jgi:SH3 domain protein
VKAKITGLLWMSALVSLPLQAESVRYISDDLITYLHTGPSNQYRILGSINAGDTVKLIADNDQKGFSQIKDTKGRTGWINSKYLAITPSLKEKLPLLEKKIDDLNLQLTANQTQFETEKSTFENTLESRQNRIDSLTVENTELLQTLTTLQADNNVLSARMDEKQNDLLMRWFGFGGLVAGIGLLMGLVLPHLVSRKPKRRSGWA